MLVGGMGEGGDGGCTGHDAALNHLAESIKVLVNVLGTGVSGETYPAPKSG